MPKRQHWASKLKEELEGQRALIRKLYDKCEALEDRALTAEMACEHMKHVVARKEEERKVIEAARLARKEHAALCERIEALNEENRVLYRRVYQLDPPEGSG